MRNHADQLFTTVTLVDDISAEPGGRLQTFGNDLTGKT